MNPQAATTEKVCSQRSDIAAYIDGELRAREELELEMHLAVCQECNKELNEQKKLLRVLDFAFESENEIEMPANFTRIVIANAESKVSGLRRPQERLKALFVCAALFLLILLGLGGETKPVFAALGKFLEQFLAVSGFVWNLIYDAAYGAAIILRSISQQMFFNSNFSFAVLLGLFFISMIALSRLVTRSTRP
jgi:hypothetical protein